MSSDEFGRSIQEFLNQHPVQKASRIENGIQEKESDLSELWNRGTEEQKMRSYAFQYLGLGLKSTGALRQKLRARGYEQEKIEALIEELEQRAYLADEELARKKIQARLKRGAGEAPALIRARLLQQGVKADAVDQVLQEELPSREELAYIWFQKTYGRKLNSFVETGLCTEIQMQKITPETKKIFSRAGRKGFSPFEVQKALNRLLEENE